MELFLALVLSHFVADFPLQGAYLSDAKREVFRTFEGTWALVAHAAMQSGSAAVAAAALGGPWQAVAASVGTTHFVIDACRVRGVIPYHVDQALHLSVMAMAALGAAWVS